MMIGETHHHHHHAPPWPAVQIHIPSPPPSSPPSNSTPPLSPTASYATIMASLRRYLFSTADVEPPPQTPADLSREPDFPAPPDDDDFFMYEFKVRKCTRARAHDWTECPFAHPGEKARRRDPRKHNYSGTACPEFRKGSCKKGDACEFAHGVFECWLHPTRFRTQACKDGSGCRRRVCFFAHHPDQLRAGSVQRSSPEFLEGGYFSTGSGSVGELMGSLRNMGLTKAKSMPRSWAGGTIIGSPSAAAPRFFSQPATPTRPGYLDWGKKGIGSEEEPLMMERVESGRELRARMFEKLSKENPLNGPGLNEGSGPKPDIGWVSDLVK